MREQRRPDDAVVKQLTAALRLTDLNLHGTNICMAYRYLFWVWLLVFVIFYACDHTHDIGILPNVWPIIKKNSVGLVTSRNFLT